MPPRDIILQAHHGLSDAELMAMPTYSGSQRQIERQREIPGRKAVDDPNILNVVIQVIEMKFLFNDSKLSCNIYRTNSLQTIMGSVFCSMTLAYKNLMKW